MRPKLPTGLSQIPFVISPISAVPQHKEILRAAGHPWPTWVRWQDRARRRIHLLAALDYTGGIARSHCYPDTKSMSFADLSGQRVDVALMRRDVLQPAEKVYVASRRGRRRHLAIFRLRIGYDWTFAEISDALGVSAGHACRITRQVQTALEKISREIISAIALSGQDTPDDLD